MRLASFASLAFLLVACGGGAGKDPATPQSATIDPAPSASTAPATSSSTTPAPSTTAANPPPGQAFCPNVGQIKFVGGQGSSVDDAVKIVGAKGEGDGVASEYACLDAAFGSRKTKAWTLLRQALVGGKDGRHYDVMSVQLADGSKKDVYFDITEYFGKF